MEKVFKICVLKSRSDPNGLVWFCHTVQELRQYKFDLKKNYKAFVAGSDKNKSNAFYIFDRYGTEPRDFELVELETFKGTKSGADGRVAQLVAQNPNNVNNLPTSLESIQPVARPASVRRSRTPSPRPSSSRVQDNELVQISIPAEPICEKLKRLSIVNNCNITDIPPVDKLSRLSMVMNTITDIPPVQIEERALSPIRPVYTDMAVSPRTSPVRQVEEVQAGPSRQSTPASRSSPVPITKKDYQTYLNKRSIYFRQRDDLATLKKLYDEDQKRIHEELNELDELLDE